MGGRDTQGVWDQHGHAAVLKMDTNMGLHGTGNSAQCNVAVWRGEDTCIWMAELLCCALEIITFL